MNSEIYFDNSATTKPSKNCIEAITECLTINYGNPSSLHNKGFLAENIVENSRNIIAHSLNVNKNEIFFTSGGTESNNLAILGAVDTRKRMGNRIITTAIEHSSVFETMKHLESLGYEVIYLKPDENDNITLEQLNNAIDNNTILVSMMYVNNETGLILPIDKVSKVIKAKKSPALFHCDAVQAYGKIKIYPKKYSMDLLTISAHKIHGPQGIGAVYIKNSVKVNPITFGGEQENKIRPGTQATALISGFGASVLEVDYNNFDYIRELQNYLKLKLKDIDDVAINSPNDNFPYILNFSILGIKSETMLHYLADKNVYVSSGSACAKGKQSHVLKALNLNKKISDSAIRVSFSKENTFFEIDSLVAHIANATSDIIRKI